MAASNNMSGGRAAVFLDRDGVLNRAVIKDGRPFPPASAEQMEILPGVIEACSGLKRAGLLLFCVTNQPDVARGLVSRPIVEEINRQLGDVLDLDAIAVCWHDDADQCDCRKPLPGLLHRLAAQYGVSLNSSIMVGDRWRDIEAGQRAGCTVVFIDHGYVERRPTTADAVFSSLADAAPWILNHLARKGL
ncbi:MAG TPA: HAD-IIIA family hydrolase [Dongiaceae bacterium]|nr:HAD-IIIA family hydrolase [Dongiaceae bacterium]